MKEITSYGKKEKRKQIERENKLRKRRKREIKDICDHYVI